MNNPSGKSPDQGNTDKIDLQVTPDGEELRTGHPKEEKVKEGPFKNPESTAKVSKAKNESDFAEEDCQEMRNMYQHDQLNFEESQRQQNHRYGSL